MQKYVPSSLVMLAPYVNSYRRLTPDMACPVNNAWGYDNRTTAFRVPISDAAARRVENRLPSSDANPYLALAASLACGWLGIMKEIEPTEPTYDTANEGSIDLPRGFWRRWHCLRMSRPSRKSSARSSSGFMPASNAASSRLHAVISLGA